MLIVQPLLRPDLDPEFLPAVLWNLTFQQHVASDPQSRRVALVLNRPAGTVAIQEVRIFSRQHPLASQNLRYIERLVKFLLWQKGASEIKIVGAPEIAIALAKIYSPDGERAFDCEFMGERTYRSAFRIEASDTWENLETQPESLPIGRHLNGYRVGFDLGGSDRKAVALIDGEVVFSEEIPWNPYFQTDPNYHIDGVQDSIARAAAHLPRVDAIGGSAAGVYVQNEVRVASLFRGVPPDLFENHIRRMFFTLQARWGGVPFEVANDGEVTALAGSMSLGENAVLGVSMGTSMAGGYVTTKGEITPWLNELAFAPIDYRIDAPRDEWSGDVGCGVQYFSQQAVARLAERAGFEFPAELSLPERLVKVQTAMSVGDPRAERIYQTLGIYFGYAVAHYAQFYEIRHLLVLGRVTTGVGGAVILRFAEEVLRQEFPPLAQTIHLSMPDEKEKRHGQAMAAASLPALLTSRVLS